MSKTVKKRLSLASVLLLLAVAAFFVFDFTAGTEAAQQQDQATESEGTEPQEGDETKEDETPAVPVSLAAVETGDVSSYLSATANLVPEAEVEVLAESEGRLASLTVEEGDRIEKGQVLAELARGDVEINVQKAQVRADTARIAYERAVRLKDQELLSSDDFDQAEQTFRLAEQELAEAEWRLEKTYIRAPFTGLVTQRNAQPGQHIRPGDSLFEVADFDPLVARIYLPEKDVLALDSGREVRLSLRADDAVSFSGKIQKISPVVDTATGTVKVTVEARQVPAAVRPGAFVRVDIVKETHQGAVLVPREAVVRELQATHVFVAEDGKARKRSVTLGLEENGRFETLSGLAAGERVVVAGQGGLDDGDPLKEVADPTAASSGTAIASARPAP